MPQETLTFHQAFYERPHRLSIKFPHYLPLYEQFLKPFQGQPVGALEIGIGTGGFLQVLQSYLGPQAQVYGLDASTENAPAEFGEIVLLTGRQEDPLMLDMVKSLAPNLSIIIDDGSHLPADQIASFEALYPHLRSPGVYMIEDTQLSYAPNHGGYKQAGTFIEYVKDRLDDINAYFSEPSDPEPTTFTKTTAGIHVYLNCIVIDKGAVDSRSPVWVEVAGS